MTQKYTYSSPKAGPKGKHCHECGWWVKIDLKYFCGSILKRFGMASAKPIKNSPACSHFIPKQPISNIELLAVSGAIKEA